MSLLVWINKERAEGHSKILKFFIIFFKIFFLRFSPFIIISIIINVQTQTEPVQFWTVFFKKVQKFDFLKS